MDGNHGSKWHLVRRKRKDPKAKKQKFNEVVGLGQTAGSFFLLRVPLVLSNAGNASRTAKLFAVSITMGVNGCFDTNAFTELLRTLATSTHA